MRVFVESANGASWFDCNDLSMWLSMRSKSIEHVWNTCIALKVLRRCGDGRYSALAWLQENKYIGDHRPEKYKYPNINTGRSDF